MKYFILAAFVRRVQGITVLAKGVVELTEFSNGSDTSVASFKEEQGIHQAVSNSPASLIIAFGKTIPTTEIFLCVNWIIT
jgi:hypothetical protein